MYATADVNWSSEPPVGLPFARHVLQRDHYTFVGTAHLPLP